MILASVPKGPRVPSLEQTASRHGNNHGLLS
jgi:hypothetical protein